MGNNQGGIRDCLRSWFYCKGFLWYDTYVYVCSWYLVVILIIVYSTEYIEQLFGDSKASAAHPGYHIFLTLKPNILIPEPICGLEHLDHLINPPGHIPDPQHFSPCLILKIPQQRPEQIQDPFPEHMWIANKDNILLLIPQPLIHQINKLKWCLYFDVLLLLGLLYYDHL